MRGHGAAVGGGAVGRVDAAPLTCVCCGGAVLPNRAPLATRRPAAPALAGARTAVPSLPRGVRRVDQHVEVARVAVSAVPVGGHHAQSQQAAGVGGHQGGRGAHHIFLLVGGAEAVGAAARQRRRRRKHPRALRQVVWLLVRLLRLLLLLRRRWRARAGAAGGVAAGGRQQDVRLELVEQRQLALSLRLRDETNTGGHRKGL